MSSRALAEGWSWAPVLTSNASSTLLGLSCLLTQYTSQKGIVLLEPGKGPRKRTVDLVLDDSSQTSLISRWKKYDSRMLGKPPLPPPREMWLNSKCRT